MDTLTLMAPLVLIVLLCNQKVLRKEKNLYCDSSICELRQARQQLETLSSIMKSKPKREIDVVYWGSTKRRSVGGDMVEQPL